MKRLKWNKRMKGVTLLVFAAALLLGATKIMVSNAASKNIFDGVYIGGLNVGGMSKEEARGALDTYVATMMEQPLALKVTDKEVRATAEDIGLSYSTEELVDEAYGVGHAGNLIKRYKDKKSLEHDNIVVNVNFDVNEELLAGFLEANLDSLNQKTVNNGLKRENGQFVFVEGKEGIIVNVEESVKAIEEYLQAGVKEELGSVELVSDVDEPKGTEEELSSVKDVLGSYSTEYTTSAPGRCQNVENATSFINGTILYPGETFSVHDTISPIALDNGYAMAGAYENGTVVESVGGGVCQVSSTLYNAVIRAELEVVERFPHSMTVHYVEPSQDAAIAGDYKDFKFKNNQDTPIYLEGYTVNKHVYFNVYGLETRDSNREISFETEIESTKEPDTKFTKTGDPIGTVRRVQSPSPGYRAVLYKIVKVNGVVESREVFNRSSYAAAAAVYEVGTGSDSNEAKKAIAEAISSGDVAKVQGAASKWNAKALKEKEKQEKEDKKDKDNKDNKDKEKDNKEDKNTDETGEE